MAHRTHPYMRISGRFKALTTCLLCNCQVQSKADQSKKQRHLYGGLKRSAKTIQLGLKDLMATPSWQYSRSLTARGGFFQQLCPWSIHKRIFLKRLSAMSLKSLRLLDVPRAIWNVLSNLNFSNIVVTQNFRLCVYKLPNVLLTVASL